MEEFINGHDHRILLYNNKILDIIMRIPAFVWEMAKIRFKD